MAERLQTNTKVVKQAVKNHILSFYRGNGGLKGFVEDVDYHRTFVTRGLSTPAQALSEMLNEPVFLFRYVDIRKFLHRIGFKDDKKLDNYRGSPNLGWSDGSAGLYSNLIINNGVEMYLEYKKKHAPKKVR